MKQPIIEIFPENASINSQKLPNGRMIYSQVGYVQLSGKYPREISIPLEDKQPAYKTGKYWLDLTSYHVNQYGKLELQPYKLVLVPIK